MSGYQAHHVFPQEFRKEFADFLHINVDDPRYGVWLEVSHHTEVSKTYNLRWREFFDTERTSDDAFALATELANIYGYELNIPRP